MGSTSCLGAQEFFLLCTQLLDALALPLDLFCCRVCNTNGAKARTSTVVEASPCRHGPWRHHHVLLVFLLGQLQLWGEGEWCEMFTTFPLCGTNGLRTLTSEKLPLCFLARCSMSM